MIFVRHGRVAQPAALVTHGTVMSLSLASVVPSVRALRFWTELRNPDAWADPGCWHPSVHAAGNLPAAHCGP